MTNYRFIATVLACGLFATGVRAEDYVRYKARPGSTVHLDGAANVHEWTMDGTLIGGYFDVPAGVSFDAAQAAVSGAPGGKIAARAEVSIPVTSIVNVTWQGMSEVMQDAMGATNFPDIQFHLSELTLKQPHAAGTPFEFDTKGDLAIKGTTNKISMPVSIEPGEKGQLKISAKNVVVKMTDYKVPPPVKAGLFTTEPDVKISFTWIVKPSVKSSDAK